MNKKRWIGLGISLAVAAFAFTLWGVLQTREGSRGLLYQVTGKQGTVYLLGSIHVGNEAMYPFGDTITQAMAASDTFVYECDTTSATAIALMKSRMALPSGETLRDVLGDALYDQLVQVCKTLQLDSAVLDDLKPWAVINTLAVYATAAEIGTDNANQAMSLGVEKQVQTYAQRNKKKIDYLETLTQQVDMLEGFSEELKLYLLQNECDVILHPETVFGMDATIADWPQWWYNGDDQAFAQHYLSGYIEPGHEEVCLEYHTKLVTQRNARMADRLSQLLDSGGTYFVTVGLLHLALPQDSIATLLGERGYQVTLLSRP